MPAFAGMTVIDTAHISSVASAKAGAQRFGTTMDRRIPAFAGMTTIDTAGSNSVAPAKAGAQRSGATTGRWIPAPAFAGASSAGMTRTFRRDDAGALFFVLNIRKH